MFLRRAASRTKSTAGPLAFPLASGKWYGGEIWNPIRSVWTILGGAKFPIGAERTQSDDREASNDDMPPLQSQADFDHLVVSFTRRSNYISASKPVLYSFRGT